MPIVNVIQTYQPPKIEDESVDVDTVELELDTDFKKNTTQKEGIYHDVYERPKKEYLQESP